MGLIQASAVALGALGLVAARSSRRVGSAQVSELTDKQRSKILTLLGSRQTRPMGLLLLRSLGSSPRRLFDEVLAATVEAEKGASEGWGKWEFVLSRLASSDSAVIGAHDLLTGPNRWWMLPVIGQDDMSDLASHMPDVYDVSLRHHWHWVNAETAPSLDELLGHVNVLARFYHAWMWGDTLEWESWGDADFGVDSLLEDLPTFGPPPPPGVEGVFSTDATRYLVRDPHAEEKCADAGSFTDCGRIFELVTRADYDRLDPCWQRGRVDLWILPGGV